MFAIDVDSPEQHSAMIEKLDLPFPLLSDPDRSLAIEPLGLSDPKHPGKIAHPAIIIMASDGREAYRKVSRDFADRLPEDDLIDTLGALGLPPTRQVRPAIGSAVPGERAMPEHAMLPYWRGARFAAVALGSRHPQAKDDADQLVAQMDRFTEAFKARLR